MQAKATVHTDTRVLDVRINDDGTKTVFDEHGRWPNRLPPTPRATHSATPSPFTPPVLFPRTSIEHVHFPLARFEHEG